MVTKKGWASQFMIGAFKKEATYGAGVTMDANNACSMRGFEAEVAWDDTVVNDKEDVTGSEHGTTQEITEERVSISYKEAKAKPNSIIALAALTLGSVTSTQDGEYDAWKHKIVPVAAGTALPSTQAEGKVGGIQRAYKGIKGNTLKIAGEAGGMVSIEAALLGDGSRATSATAFAAVVSESWLKISQAKFFMEDGSDISIAATLTQGAQNISSDTPVDLSPRFKSFELNWDNALEPQPGAGGAGRLQDIDYGRRKAELKFSLLFYDGAELGHYLNQNPLAVEFDLKGALIDEGGSMYYGVQIIVPRFMLRTAPLAKGGANDSLTIDCECDVQDNGTDPVVIIEAYNAMSAYLAA